MLERELLKVSTERDLAKYTAYIWFKGLRLTFCNILDPLLSRSSGQVGTATVMHLSKHSKTTPTYDSSVERHYACG